MGLMYKQDSFKFGYVPYILNYADASANLEKIRKRNQKFKDFLQVFFFLYLFISLFLTSILQNNIEDPRSKGHEISSFLIQPIQRLPRYELLLKV